MTRIPCCIPKCRRTFKPQPDDGPYTITMCGRHWRMGDERLRKRHKELRKRTSWFKRKWRNRNNVIAASPKAKKFDDAWDRAVRAANAMWDRIQQDVTIKAALGAEDAPRRRPRSEQ